ncbi:TIGR02679 family protein [Nocardiopsis potens]|uniref:TIGR02679 family protein n=1 Tax=Nocardiopsis potens TaxID=1246458 RepID=UPI00037768CD|nr:TIGR02679 family protein [Nocardiopsis potens]
MAVTGDGGFSGVDHPRLERLLGGPDLRWLVERVRERLARGEPATGNAVLTAATAAQRAAAQRLLGRPPRRGRSLTVSLDAVDAVLRRSGISPAGLAAAVEALTGPVQVRPDAEAAEARAWDRAFAPLAAVCGEDPRLDCWYRGLRASGLARRILGEPSAAGPALHTLADVVAALPGDGIGLGTFAARVCGDAHALDDGRPLGTLALGAARALTGTPAGSGAEWRREAWAAAGLLRDDLSTTVLATGLPGDGRTATGRALAALRAAGQPAVLTLRQLVGDPPLPLPAGSPVHVCENPAVVAAAADRFGPECPPLVCTQGQPGAAAVTLLRLLSDAGTGLYYHGDFDWGGVRIANALLRRVPWRAWRFTASDYRAAVSEHDAAGMAGPPLSGAPVSADWDPDLESVLLDRGLRIEEEAVLELLLDDLSTARDRPPFPR